MATIRVRRRGVWEVRSFTGASASGAPTQVSRTVHGGKKDALRVAAELTFDAKWRLHDLRHWSASVAIAAGHDVKTVADRLGHANAAMTLRVNADAFAASDRAVADSVGAALDGDE